VARITRAASIRRIIKRFTDRDRDGRNELMPGPIHGELLGAERLAERARALAHSQRLAAPPVRAKRAPLLDRLTSTRQILASVQAQLSAAVAAGTDPGPAGEWLLDNYYVVQEHLREVHESLPRGYYRELPELAGGPLSGYPRVYEIATTLISHTEARVDLENTDLFVGAFQEVVPLTIGELWAVPAMVRLALLESVRRMALRTAQRLDQIEEADRWAERIREASESGRADLGAVLGDFMADPPKLTSHFIERFLQQLRRARGAFPALVALEAWIAEEAVSAEEAAARSTQRLAATQVAMANGITSLRAVARMDWPLFVERQSRMEAVLRTDPSGFYPRMTFETRDSYRHVVERIARRTGLDEEEVAHAAVQLAVDGEVALFSDRRRRHVGYYLVDHGIRELERVTGFTTRPEESVRRWILRHPDFVLVGGIAGGTVIALVALIGMIGPEGRAAWLAALLLGLIPASEIAVSTLNLLIARMLAPGHLPKLELRREGVPAEFRTAVVVPTLFGGVHDVEEALENLEVQFLANRGDHLHFAVLSDFVDAPAETVEGDDAIVAAAVEGVRNLNQRYGGGREDTFYLLHRPRRWNEAEGVWMGWERKRGKLSEFNRFVRGGAQDAFSVIVGDPAPLRDVRYVITLDSDTVLPPEAAPLLIGTIAHPLNRAVYDAARGRVVRGYGILQPRVGVSLPSAYRSRFSAIFSGQPGVDPYTTAVSDVYQDLYREGSFTGKGIYDVDAFEAATRDRFPENALLSHDLIEGSYARAGLATDITVYDDYPTRYLTYTRRKHRWTRGDWQLLPWLGPRVRSPRGPAPNTLAVLSRWKIFDNLRRSTVEIAQVAFFIAGWLILPGSPLRWTAIGLGAIAAPWILSLLFAVLNPPFDRSWRAYYASVLHDAETSAQQVGLAVAFLAHQAWVSADAFVRTLWRLFVSRRKLLEWQTFSGTERALAGSARLVWRAMLPAVVLGIALLLIAGLGGLAVSETAADGSATAEPRRLWLLAAALVPVAGLWIMSPAIARALDAAPVRRQRTVPAGRRSQALGYALLHWRFFDRFATAETNWLTPDNFQEDPAPVVAMRTSPTNIGLHLLATVSAHDLGFITLPDMLDRLENTFGTLARMSRFRGHFYNWYDVRDLRVLEPAYVSTVDSGNLAGHLIALRQACLSIRPDEGADGRVVRALECALALAAARLDALSREGEHGAPDVRRAFAAAGAHLEDARAALRADRGDRAGLARAAAPIHLARDVIRGAGLAPDAAAEAVEWLVWSANRIDAEAEERTDAARYTGRLEALAERAYAYALEMDFRFLFDPGRKLFAIGYDQATRSLEPSYYDLLASEARLASFIAIAKDDVEVDHWFRLGRSLTHAAGATALVSWSGSMFEYLMPLLVMRSFPLTLLDQTNTGAVRRHIEYGEERDVPWGVSESAYNLRDRHMTYQYRAFGVPDLALKRGLAHDLIVAPYASALALMVDTVPALDNLSVLERAGALGPYGFRDALDYTRPEPGKRCAIVYTYMAHHIGMSFVALTNVLRGEVWQDRFHADSLVRAAELLLYERIPRRVMLQAPQTTHPDEARIEPALDEPTVREFETTGTARPHVALLGYPPYTLMLSHCGGGYSSYGPDGRAVTRWRADGTTDDTGQFCYVRDLTAERAWSTAHQPTCAPADWYRALLATDRVTFHRADGAVETRTEIVVVPEDAAEVRRVTVTNNGASPRELEITSYGEIVLAPAEADKAHPAFSKLFVETEFHGWCSAVTATRRPRSAHEPTVWCVHVLATGKERVGEVTCETDRARFLGRGRSPREPIALEGDGPLSGTTGAVLDPIFSLRARLRLEPGQSGSVAFTTLIAPTRERAFELADRYHDPHTAQRALDLAWTSAQVELREMGITSADAAVFQELAGHLLYPIPPLRAPEPELRRNRGSQPLLWENGISGDLPILLATIQSADGLPTLQELFAAHHFWRRHGLKVDLVVLNAHRTAYFQELNDQVLAALSAASGTGVTDVPGGVYVRRRQLLSRESLLMLEATAAVHLSCDGSAIADILEDAARRLETPVRRPPPRRFRRAAPPPVSGDGRVLTPLRFDNTFGGLDEDFDYEVRVRGDHAPPAPWSNVVANPRGGFVVTDRGAGFTWVENSYFFRLTPWHNDAVCDAPGEVLYLQDPESGALWSATPAPVRSDGLYRVRHGAGATTFEHERAAIATRLTLGMAEEDAVKIALLRVTNRDTRPRRIGVTAYAEWTLGVSRERTQHLVHTTFDAERRAILARNDFDPQFAGWTAYCALSEPVTGHTADRREFLGRNGTTADPEALARGRLAGATGAALDPCAALQCTLALAPGETRTVVVLLGAANGEAEARDAIARFRDVARAEEALDAAAARWQKRLSVVRVRTPAPSFDAMLNRWSLYQALACRMWGRSALYQSSGAFGFRDQLQDVMAFVYAEPAIAREHILRAAARQFVEGDVQHWWHPQSGRGVRTRFSDDLVWLPYVVEHYVRVTGDASVLDEVVPFLEMRALAPEEHEVYDLPRVSSESATIYEHCVRALRRACTEGAHGLPLIGAGDWNDGMNRVGVHGRGESVWLGWFLTATLRSFGGLAQARDDEDTHRAMRGWADAYAAAVEAHGWDGEWYRRAYFDDGTPLGSAANTECRIDAIAQSWSVISGAGDPDRQARALRAVEEHLVREDARLIQLLAPPFDQSPQDPGYIKGYVPGVRENGAQYTHAALWTVLSSALRGDGERAFELYQMLNPLEHARTPEEVHTYRVEPYVVAADVYTAEGNLGRGGWTWYTGSASWMYRVGLEALLGFRKAGDTLAIEPRVPASWPGYSIEYRFGGTTYVITVEAPAAIGRGGGAISLDGELLDTPVIPLADDGGQHEVVVRARVDAAAPSRRTT
jgi:cellobiose phosphorylase